MQRLDFKNKRIKTEKALEHEFFINGLKIKNIIGGMENKQTRNVINTWISLQKDAK